MVALRKSKESTHPCLVLWLQNKQKLAIVVCVVAFFAVVQLHQPFSGELSETNEGVIQSSSSTTTTTTTTTSHYNPLNCTNLTTGHCKDEQGGAWSYRKANGECSHTEENAPQDKRAATALARIFPDVRDGVLDFGGGLGPYLLSFRDQEKPTSRLVVMEPHNLEGCLFRGLEQDTTDVVNTPLSQLPVKQFDMVMTIEVLEHVPAEFHDHVMDALTQATRRWLLFSAAHPGQPGEGHVGPSMKTREQWIKDITAKGILQVDEAKTKEFHESCYPNSLLRTNGVVFRRVHER